MGSPTVANLQAGGLIGSNSGTIVSALGNVQTGDASAAGRLVASNLVSGAIISSQASGNVTVASTSFAGGLAGQNLGTIAGATTVPVLPCAAGQSLKAAPLQPGDEVWAYTYAQLLRMDRRYVHLVGAGEQRRRNLEAEAEQSSTMPLLPQWISLSLLPLRQFGVHLEARRVKNMDKEAHHGADCEGDGG